MQMTDVSIILFKFVNESCGGMSPMYPHNIVVPTPMLVSLARLSRERESLVTLL